MNINYPIPSDDNQGFVILNIAMAAVKRTIPEANTIGNLNEKDQNKMIKLGTGVNKGNISPSTYSRTLIDIIERIIKKKISKQDKNYLDDKIQRYIRKDLVSTTVKSSFNPSKVKTMVEMLEKLTNKKVLLEERTKPKYEYGCAMLFFNFDKLKEIQKKINTEDIYDKPTFGLETEPHTTLLYGFKTKEIESYKDIIDCILEFKIPALELYNISCFENKEYDVLKFECREHNSKKNILNSINKKLTDIFPYHSDYPDYNPHSTIAYLKSGKGQKYIDMFKDQTYVVNPEKIVYSEPTKDGEKTIQHTSLLKKENLLEDVHSDYLKWKRKNVTVRGMREKGVPNGGGAMLGDGLYTACLSNHQMAKPFGKIHFVLGAIPKNPKTFNTLNDWEIWFWGNIAKKYKDKRDFRKDTTIEVEMLKLGYDGIIIKGREMVNFNPIKSEIKYFESEENLEDYYNKNINKTPILENSQMAYSKYIKPIKLDERLEKIIKVDEEKKIVWILIPTVSEKVEEYLINKYSNYIIKNKFIEDHVKIDEDSKTVYYDGPTNTNSAIRNLYPFSTVINTNSTEKIKFIEKNYNLIKANENYEIIEELDYIKEGYNDMVFYDYGFIFQDKKNQIYSLWFYEEYNNIELSNDITDETWGISVEDDIYKYI